MPEPLIEIKDLRVEFNVREGVVKAVDGFNRTIHRGETVGVIGESGCGKSVTARAILNMVPKPGKVSGEILYHRRAKDGSSDGLSRTTEVIDLTKVDPDGETIRQVRGGEIGMIFQEPMTALNPVLRIGAQIDEVLEVHQTADKMARRLRVLEMLAAVHLPDPEKILTAYPHQLSGGQRQRAMIAMALALQPDILIADEPTTALDVTTQAQILALIREVQREQGMGVIFVTHDFGVVAEVADRIAVMQHGRIVEQGTSDEVLSRPRADYTRTLLAAVPSLTPGPKRDFSTAAEVVVVKDLNKSFSTGSSWFGGAVRRVDALAGVSFNVRRGETVGIVGESGSGKTTVARCIVRLLEADSGEILINGQDIVSLDQRALRPIRKRVQMVFQDPFGSLNPRRTVGQLIQEGPIVHGVTVANARARTVELLELVGLDQRAVDRYPHEFSGGQRQRIGLARALALEPEILVADEPVSALDVSVQAQVLSLLADIRARLGLTVVFITHDLRVASQVCDSVAVMRHGRIVEFGSVADVYADPKHAYTRELLDSVPGRLWSDSNDAKNLRGTAV